jgi:hypothetical protein
MDRAPLPQNYPLFLPAALGIAGALILTVVLTILFLRFGDRAIKVASMMLLSALISLGAAYFACAAYVLLAGNETAWGQALRANGADALGVPSAALAAFALVVLLPTIINEPVEFEGFTIKIKGPTVQIVLWVICFICIVGARRLLLPKTAIAPRASSTETVSPEKK